MSVSSMKRAFAAGVTAAVLSGATALTQSDVVDPAAKPLPNPTPKVIKNWGTLPDGRTWGSTAGVDIGPDGHVWAYDRCGANTCAGSNVDPILKFDRNSGKLLASFGGGHVHLPARHPRGPRRQRLGDRRPSGEQGDWRSSRRGARATRSSSSAREGKVLMTLGKAGRGRERPGHVQRAERRDHRAERRHLRVRRPQRQNPTATPEYQRRAS